MHLLIAAAGSGSRMGADRNKLLLEISGRPVLAWTLDAAMRADSIKWIGIVGRPSDQESILSITQTLAKPVQWIDGGDTRQESVQKGLAALPPTVKHVLIHDGARCLVQSELFDRCAQIVQLGTAVIAANPITDTIKRVDAKGLITDTPQRSELWAAQTPQGFPVIDLKKAHQKAIENNWIVTDDASLFERLGLPVKILESAPSNIKVTTPFDLLVAEALISKREGR